MWGSKVYRQDISPKSHRFCDVSMAHFPINRIVPSLIVNPSVKSTLLTSFSKCFCSSTVSHSHPHLLTFQKHRFRGSQKGKEQNKIQSSLTMNMKQWLDSLSHLYSIKQCVPHFTQILFLPYPPSSQDFSMRFSHFPYYHVWHNLDLTHTWSIFGPSICPTYQAI